MYRLIDTGHTNQDVTVTVDGLNRFLSGGGVTYDYDDRGNMTADGVRTYAYDFDNRLTNVSGGGVGAVALTYDPAGRLYQTAQTGGATTRFLGACPRACPVGKTRGTART